MLSRNGVRRSIRISCVDRQQSYNDSEDAPHAGETAVKVAGKRTTRANETYQSLRTGILSGDIPAGSRLRTNELCSQFKVSLGAVREALTQLIAQGLVVSEAHQGFTASPVSADDLLDLTRVRIEIETTCLAWAIRAGTVEWESNIIAALHRLSRTHRAGDRIRPGAEWTEAHDKYHLALLATCDSPRLMGIRHQLYAQSERYRNLEISLPLNRDPEGEHQRIAEAAIARDVALATQRMREHLTLTANNVLKSIDGSRAAPRRSAPARKRAIAARAQSPAAAARAPRAVRTAR
jgi:DNA-binding GntR family transcriptional regulator